MSEPSWMEVRFTKARTDVTTDQVTGGTDPTTTLSSNQDSTIKSVINLKLLVS